jgi:hypothetical protein
MIEKGKKSSIDIKILEQNFNEEQDIYIISKNLFTHTAFYN